MPLRLPPLPLPENVTQDLAQDLGLPARDILRGVRRMIAGPLRLLEPVGAMFPEPVQHVVDDLRQSVKRGVREVSGADAAGDADAVAAAMQPSVFTGSGDAVARFARVAYFGLRHVLRRLDRQDLSVSETVAGFAFHTALSDCPADADAASKAAAIAASLTRHHVIGVAPGTGIGLDAVAVAESRLAAFVVLLWLLLERPETEANEAELLDLCYAVGTAQRLEILAAEDDTLVLADLLRSDARMI